MHGSRPPASLPIGRSPHHGNPHRHPGPRAGTVATERDQVDDVPRPSSTTPGHHRASSQKRGWPSPRRQRPIDQGPDASAARRLGPPVRVRTSRSPPSTVAASCNPNRRIRCATDVCGGMRRGGWTRIRRLAREAETLGRAAAAGAGTALRVVCGRRSGRRGTELRRARIHLIAIRPSRPWTAGRPSARGGPSTGPAAPRLRIHAEGPAVAGGAFCILFGVKRAGYRPIQ